jgi:nicotinate-nucleotide adenylyltransferase
MDDRFTVSSRAESPRARRVAFFGGSFDPPHRGHVAVARAALQALALDQVIFAPVALQPLKMHGPASGASFADRVEMTRLAIRGEARFSVSLADSPNPTGRPNYTVETLTQLRAALGPHDQLFLMLGADAFRLLPRWHRAPELLTLAGLIVVARPGEDLSDPGRYLPAGWTLAGQADENANPDVNGYRVFSASGAKSSLQWLPGLQFEVSATRLRESIHGSADPAQDLLDPAVLDYIHTHGLYR